MSKDLISALLLLGRMPEMYLIAISVKDYSRLSMELSPAIVRSLKTVEKGIRRITEITEQEIGDLNS